MDLKGNMCKSLLCNCLRDTLTVRVVALGPITDDANMFDLHVVNAVRSWYYNIDISLFECWTLPIPCIARSFCFSNKSPVIAQDNSQVLRQTPYSYTTRKQ